jgi:NADH:ubiquinone oxidoreductase subunit 2 (subunit N)
VRLLAYSSIAQSGYLLMGVAALEGSSQGLPALVYYALAYAAMNSPPLRSFSASSANEDRSTSTPSAA